jgi:hypothetical protein
MYDSQMQHCAIWRNNLFQYRYQYTFFADSTSMYKFSSAFIKCHLFIRHGVQSQLCSATRAPNLSFKYAKCFIMYSAAEIIIQQSCPNKAKATSCLIIQFSRVQSETCSYALCNIMPTIIFTATDGISKQGAQLLLERQPHPGK